MKKTYKSIFVILTLVMLLVVVLSGCAPVVGTEMVANGDFELLDKDNAPEGWEIYRSEASPDSSYNRVPVSPGSVDSEKHGFSYLTVQLTTVQGAAYYEQKVKLFAGQTYAFTIDYMIEGSMSIDTSKANAVGAFFGFKEDRDFTVLSARTTDDRWVSRTVYFKPSITANYTLVCGIGREDIGGATGKVAFDNVSIKSVDAKSVPVGATVHQVSPSQKITKEMAGGVAYTIVFTILGVVVMFASYFAIRNIIRKDAVVLLDGSQAECEFTNNENQKVVNDGIENIKNTSANKKTGLPFKQRFNKENIGKTFTSPLAMFIYVMLATLGMRVLFLLVTGGMVDYLARYGELALAMANDGFSMAYSTSLNLPAGYLYVLYLVGLLAKAVNMTATSVGMGILLRTPNIIADLVISYLIFSMMNKHYNYKYSAIIAGIFAINPLFFTASTTYGLNFSISLAFLIGMVGFMLSKNFIGAISMYTLAFMFNNYMLILLPLIVIYDVYYCVKDKKAILPIVLTSVLSVVVFYLIALPFSWNKINSTEPLSGVFLVFTKILDNIKNNVVVTNSTFNFFAIFGLGSNKIDVAMKVCVGLVMALFAVVACYYYNKSRNRLDFIYISAMSFILWTVFGVGAILETMVIGIALLLVYAGIKGERRIFVGTTVLSITSFVNMAVLLARSGSVNFYPNKTSVFKPFYHLDPLLIIGSLIVTICAIYLLYVGYDIMVNKMEADIKAMPENYLAVTKQNIVSFKNRSVAKVKKVFKKK